MTEAPNTENHPSLLEMIGIVAATWSLIELVVQGAIWKLAKLPNPDTGRAITTHMSNPMRLDVLMSLARLSDMPTDKVDALDALCNKLRRNLAPRRNDVVHGLWGDIKLGMLESQLHKISARGKVAYDITPRKASDLAVLTMDIANAGQEMMTLVNFDDMPGTWREISLQPDSSPSE